MPPSPNISLVATQALDAARTAAREQEGRNLVSFLARLLLQEHEGRVVLRVDRKVPPVRFEYGPVIGDGDQPTGEMYIQVVEQAPDTAPRLVVPEGGSSVILPGSGLRGN